MTKRGTVVPHLRPAPGGTHGRTGTCREVGESQGRARGGLTRRRFDWQGAAVFNESFRSSLAPKAAPGGRRLETGYRAVPYRLVRAQKRPLSRPLPQFFEVMR